MSALLLAMQLSMSLTPGQSVTVTCSGQWANVQTTTTLRGDCVAVPPPATGTASLCDANLNENALIVHPEPLGSGRTWEGFLQIDDRVTQSYRACGRALDHVDLWLNHDSMTNGVLVVRVYAHAGTYGVSSKPAGAVAAASTPTPGWLAESDPLVLNMQNMPAGILRYSVRFSGLSRIRRTAGTALVFSVDWRPSSTDQHNTIGLHADSLGRHAGNLYNDAPCTSTLTCNLQQDDLRFAVYEAQ